MRLSFIVPCYNEEENIRLFYNDLKDNFKKSKYDIEIVFINDGSKDNTILELKKIVREKDFKIKIINFSKNFGKEAGIYAGLKESTGDYVVLIDADMQQRPRLVLNMLEKMEQDNDIDIVAYYQDKRVESRTLSGFKWMFYRIISKMTRLKFTNGASDFRLMKRNVVDAILSLSEHNRFSKGIFAYIGFNTKDIPYVPEKRKYGKTSWSFKKLFNYAYEGILSFISNPFKLLYKLGLFNVFISIIWLIVLLILSINMQNIQYILLFILFMFGITFVILGFMGEYIYRGYEESRNRPMYIVKEIITNEK